MMTRKPDRLLLQTIQHGNGTLFHLHAKSCTEMTTETMEAAMIGQRTEHRFRTDGELRLLITDPGEQDDAVGQLGDCRRCRDRLGELSVNALTVERAMSTLTDGCGTTDVAWGYAKVTARIRPLSKSQQDTEGMDQLALPSPSGIGGEGSYPSA